MKDDQWFNVGDKVTRVVTDAEFIAKIGEIPFHSGVRTNFGTVYCVSKCWIGKRMNLVSFVGIPNSVMPNGMSRGYPAIAFRRVSEIQLCVRAAEHFKKPVEVESGSLNNQALPQPGAND